MVRCCVSWDEGGIDDGWSNCVDVGDGRRKGLELNGEWRSLMAGRISGVAETNEIESVGEMGLSVVVCLSVGFVSVSFV